MSHIPFATSLFRQDSGSVLHDLLRNSLRSLILLAITCTWIWALSIEFLAESNVPLAYAALAAVLAVGLLCYWLLPHNLLLSAALFFASLLGTVTVLGIAIPNTSIFYLYILVVLMTIPLANGWATWGVAAGALTSIAWIGLGIHSLPPVELLMPSALVVASGLTAWLSSHQLANALGWALNMTDRAQKSAEEARAHRAELQRVMKSLDQAYTQLERVNRALVQAQDAAEKAYRFKSQFVANVSHELRTPLNLIIGFSEMIATAPENYGGRPLPREYRGDLMTVYRSARHLQELINDVLDLSQLEASKMAILKVPTELNEIVHEAAEIVHGLAEAHSLYLHIEMEPDLPMLDLDRTRVRQVILNLLTNAFRFTHSGGVTVRACLDGKYVRVDIEDTGQGIPAENLAHAFDAFSRLHEGQTADGNGLGLAISKRFIELHQGEIWIDSTLGQGTAVHFTLPTSKVDRRPPLSPAYLSGCVVDRRHGRPLVAVLHEDSQLVSTLQRQLNDYEFVMAHSPADLRKLCVADPPNIVLIDSDLGRDDPDVLDAIDRSGAALVVSAQLPSVHRHGRALGALDLLPKPVDRRDLWVAIGRLPKRPRSILVVDDDLDIVQLLVRMLRAGEDGSGGGLVIMEAFSCNEALDILRRQRPDLVLLDIVMPGEDGRDLLADIAADAALVDTQVILISSFGLDQDWASSVPELQIRRSKGFSLTETIRLLEMLFAAATPKNAGDRSIVPG